MCVCGGGGGGHCLLQDVNIIAIAQVGRRGLDGRYRPGEQVHCVDLVVDCCCCAGSPGGCQMLVILQSVVDTGGKVERHHFAKRLNDWMIFGFPELGDVGM